MTSHDYSGLKSDRIIATAEKLSNRIQERFPHSSLLKISREVTAVAKGVEQEASFAARPVLWIRLLSYFLIALIVTGIIGGLVALEYDSKAAGFFEVVQTLEAAINEVILIGLGIVFLAGLESRVKRRRICDTVFRLRSMAHIIDMHQLTKDPERLLKRGIVTSNSPSEKFSNFELERYFDYCSEMLSLIAKLAALFTESFSDPGVTAAVNEIENLCNGLSRKIWQKIMILYFMNREAV